MDGPSPLIGFSQRAFPLASARTRGRHIFGILGDAALVLNYRVFRCRGRVKMNALRHNIGSRGKLGANAENAAQKGRIHTSKIRIFGRAFKNKFDKNCCK